MRSAVLLVLAATACGSQSEPPPAAARDAAAVAVTPPVAIDARGVVVDATAAAPLDAAAPRPSARCAGLPGAAEVDVLPTRDDVHTFHVRAGDERWLVFDGPKACHVTPVGRADARADGAFWPGVAEARAFVLAGEPCEVDADEHLIGCVAVVGLRDPGGAMLDAIETCSASMSPGLHRAPIFADQDSLIVSCPDLTGYGLSEQLVLVHAIDGRLRVVLAADGSWGDHGPSDACTGCTRHCWTELDAARWRVVARGAAPVIETTAPLAYPRSGNGEDAQAELDRQRAADRNRIRWRFDPGKGAFVAERRSHVDTTPADDVCAAFPLGSPLD